MKNKVSTVLGILALAAILVTGASVQKAHAKAAGYMRCINNSDGTHVWYSYTYSYDSNGNITGAIPSANNGESSSSGACSTTNRVDWEA